MTAAVMENLLQRLFSTTVTMLTSFLCFCRFFNNFFHLFLVLSIFFTIFVPKLQFETI